ncbi:MAG TPA: tetratricopeptide repeat protein, partial [Vicinamibacteria bacterium]|nr:tetratricopeptide repeat protein [Vicinamibacteria bacterium]
ARTLAEAGRRREAEEAARGFMGHNARSAEMWNTLGELLHGGGRVDEARAAFEKAIAGRARDALVAEVNLAILRFEKGERDEATKGFHRLIDAYNGRDDLASEELAAVGTACRYLGAEDPELFKDALKAFDEAIAADRDNLDARVKLAELFLEKYNGADAAATVAEALERQPGHARALLALARVRDFDGAPGVVELVERSLAANPNLAEARLFLAEIKVAQEDFADAAELAEGVLAANPASQPALAVLAAARYLQEDRAGFEEARRKALALNPRNAEFYNTVAEVCVRNRLYAEAVDFAAQAVALDGRSWRGFGLLGLNQLRIGQIEAGRKSLDASFAGDPYNVWIKNTLDLLDTFPQYVETTTPRFRLLIHGKESALLAPYVAELAEDAYTRLAERYRFSPAVPIRIEVYPSHGDFSVRTVGLAGLGALGACFGPVLALDSPSAREIGQFNWGSTLWHELAHTVTLGASDGEVPRWLGEGLSVLEERRARPGWGDDLGVEFLEALRADELLPIGELNNGFVRPTGPDQIGISYYQASLVAEWIEAQRGFAAVLDLLKAYREGRTTEEAFRGVLSTSLEEFDRGFLAHLKERYAGPLSGLAEFEKELAAGVALVGQKKLAEAQPRLERARALFPEYGGDNSPYWFLAMIHKEKGEARRMAEELARLTAINERHYRAHLELAKALEDEGDAAGAAATLERALYIWPFDPGTHQRLAALHGARGDPAGVVRARRSLVALDPVDRPEALYQLALALVEAGDAAGARREVVRALELAPRFRRAQELLLRLHRGAGPSPGASR